MKEHVPLLTELRVGIYNVCKFVQFLFPWLILDENNNNNNKWDKINKINILTNRNSGEIDNKYPHVW